MSTLFEKTKTAAPTNSDDLDALYNTWEFFQKHHWVAPGITHTPIIDAWERCRRQSSPFNWHAPHVASGMTFRSLLKRTGNLLTITHTVLEDTFGLLANKCCALIVTDETGCTLLMMGHALMCEKLTSLGIKEGAFWSEGRVGSNAISQSLHLSDPVSIYGAQHFNRSLHDVSGHAAPVFSLDGRQRGVLALFTKVGEHQAQDCALITSCAREVSSRLHLETSLSESNHILSQRDALLTGMDEGVIAWDNSKRISYLNVHAEQRLNLDKRLVVGKALNSLLLFPPLVKNAIKQNLSLSRVEVTFQCGDAFIEATISFKPIAQQSYLLFLHPIESRRIHSQDQAGTDVSLDFDFFVAHSKQMKQLLTIAKRVCKSPSPLLLLGEDGCGKRQLAKAIHDNGLRRSGPFITFDCASLEGDRVLLELFASDAQDKPGKVEQANGGTLYLEHIECLSRSVQTQLLHLLKTNSIRCYQTNQVISMRLNLICSTQLRSDSLLSLNHFSRPFYYAVSTVELSMPALRERPEDLPLLIEQQLARLNARYQCSSSFSHKAKESLCLYTWPGNLAELNNCIEKCLLQRRGDKLGVQDLPAHLLNQGKKLQPVQQSIQPLAVLEKQSIEQALVLYHGKSQEMAAALGIGRTTLWRKLKKYQLINED